MRFGLFLSTCGCALAAACSVYDVSFLGVTSGQGGGSATSTGAWGTSGNDGGARGGGSSGSTAGGAGPSSSTTGAGGASSGSGGGGGAPDGGLDGATNGADAELDSGFDDRTSPSDASCTAEGILVFCIRNSANCGSVTGIDNCGSQVTFNCGTCPSRDACGAQVPHRCGNAVSLAMGGTVSSSSPNMPPEDMTAAFDGQTNTKWFAGNGVITAWIAYEFGGDAPHVVTSYTITSANDRPGRDPSAWQFQGSTDGQSWTTLDVRSSQTFANRFQTNAYTSSSTTPYPRYRLNITANAGAPETQLAEIQLFGY